MPKLDYYEKAWANKVKAEPELATKLESLREKFKKDIKPTLELESGNKRERQHGRLTKLLKAKKLHKELYMLAKTDEDKTLYTRYLCMMSIYKYIN